jgi:hypothetical protein
MPTHLESRVDVDAPLVGQRGTVTVLTPKMALPLTPPDVSRRRGILLNC